MLAYVDRSTYWETYNAHISILAHPLFCTIKDTFGKVYDEHTNFTGKINALQ